MHVWGTILIVKLVKWVADCNDSCFSKNRPLADSFIESRCPSFYLSIYISVPFSCNFFRGLSLALRSHDQIPASHWSTPPTHTHIFPHRSRDSVSPVWGIFWDEFIFVLQWVLVLLLTPSDMGTHRHTNLFFFVCVWLGASLNIKLLNY